MLCLMVGIFEVLQSKPETQTTDASDRREIVEQWAVLRKVGGADGDLDAHLDGRRRFAGLAGRENPLSREDFTAMAS